MHLYLADRLGNDLDALAPQGQADITLEFSGVIFMNLCQNGDFADSHVIV